MRRRRGQREHVPRSEVRTQSVRQKKLEGTQSEDREEGGSRRGGWELSRGQAFLKDVRTGIIFNLVIMGATKGFKQRSEKMGTNCL